MRMRVDIVAQFERVLESFEPLRFRNARQRSRSFPFVIVESRRSHQRRHADVGVDVRIRAVLDQQLMNATSPLRAARKRRRSDEAQVVAAEIDVGRIARGAKTLGHRHFFPLDAHVRIRALFE